jgi:hypothetical protein
MVTKYSVNVEKRLNRGLYYPGIRILRMLTTKDENMGGGSAESHPQRDYTGVVYLNDNFTGGELVFPDRDVVIAPKPGLFVGFPSNHEFVHAVPKVLSGKRYSLPVWFTVNAAKAIQV